MGRGLRDLWTSDYKRNLDFTLLIPVSGEGDSEAGRMFVPQPIHWALSIWTVN